MKAVHVCIPASSLPAFARDYWQSRGIRRWRNPRWPMTEVQPLLGIELAHNQLTVSGSSWQYPCGSCRRGEKTFYDCEVCRCSDRELVVVTERSALRLVLPALSRLRLRRKPLTAEVPSASRPDGSSFHPASRRCSLSRPLSSPGQDEGLRGEVRFAPTSIL